MKEIAFKPIRTESLKEVFVSRFEELILSGRLSIGQKLPSERTLALQLGVSRPVVHEGLVDLAVKGLVTMKPRIGTIVNDYRKDGSLAILTSLVNYYKGSLDPALLDSMLEMRMLIEMATARLAATNRTTEHIVAFKDILKQEELIDPHDVEHIKEIDFEFHHLIALASKNLVYPLLIRSFKPVYTNLSGQFFMNPSVVPVVFRFHKTFVCAIEDKDVERSVETMESILEHGKKYLKEAIKETDNDEKKRKII
ncbi:MAG: FadR family transcriptional regulator [Deltaproteobacteria bacterium]|nr:FadR family transcriptional regulator [Deltaproteobacteria bacterium]